MRRFRILTAALAGFIGVLWCHAALAGIVTFGSGANQFSMTFVPIGSPGNDGDTGLNANPVGAGSVGYVYSIGKYEVSRDMVIKANAVGNLGITLADLSSQGGNDPDKPATGVSWNEAARFVNWLNTSSGGFAAYNFTTTGVNDNIALWTAADTLDYDPLNPFRSLRANYVLPSIDEWYKAAYYNPTTSTYSDFPNGLDTAPTPVAGGTTAGTAVYRQLPPQGPASIYNAGGLSPFGVMGLGGNASEWNETESDLVNDSGSSARVYRGGFWLEFESAELRLSSSDRRGIRPTAEEEFLLLGFRVACLSSDVPPVPEPSSLGVWTLIGGAGLWWGRRRLRN